MNTTASVRLLAAGALAIFLGACATVPKPLQGEFPGVTPRDTVAGAQAGAQVRWGGRIVETRPRADSTCFEMISAPLGATGRPLSSSPDATDGRFIACRAGFYDPAIFAKGREVTFIGRVDGFENTRIGEYDYRLPRVTADVVYLWPEVKEVQVRPYPGPYYDPFWGPGWGWGPRWGWW
ncbi:Slp family lipoprotein [Pseudoxanthomonas sp. JBR18]|uniref:Slp family lipoprotein n=1 Tax=Pseudoxanthomonas sp. JBR18 TaxID=2969308 RepID=UPI002305688F|nr:Slp family lipoprotein [Pseudoxanthomonas sp. JBR18]WCE04536.1 Slp family lipoprotein [Pseudoxanthomonas sp. JBR18]